MTLLTGIRIRSDVDMAMYKGGSIEDDWYHEAPIQAVTCDVGSKYRIANLGFASVEILGHVTCLGTSLCRPYANISIISLLHCSSQRRS